MGLIIAMSAYAVPIGYYPGLQELIDRADAIVVLRIDRHLTDFGSPTFYSTHECYIYQTIKGNIPEKTRINLQLMNTEASFATPYAHGSTHLMFLMKKATEDEPTEYRTLTFKGAQILLSPLGHEKAPEGKTIEQKIQKLIRDSIAYQTKEHEKKQMFLKAMLARQEAAEPNSEPNVQVDGKDEQGNVIHGVVYNQGGKPVPGALVLPLPYGGYPVDSDVNGKFELMGPSEHRLISTLIARDPKHNLAAGVELGDYSKPLDITLAPAVTLTGRVTDSAGKPISGADVFPSIHAKTYLAGFGYTVFEPTDSNGIYEIKALPVGQDYSIRAKCIFGGYIANSVRPGLLNEPGLKELQDIVLQPAKPTVSPGASGKREPIYDTNANAEKQISDALVKARQNNKHVLLMYGGNWCGWCYKLHDCFNENGNIKRLLQYEYELVMVDIMSNKDVPKRFNTNLEGYPYLTVLNAEGKVLVNQSTVPLAEDKSHNPNKVYAFLTKWAPEPLNADEVYEEALALAEKENKRVFLHFGAPWCGWCHRLEDFLALPEIVRIMAGDYILVKIDLERMVGAKTIDNRIRQESGGIPWFAILDAKGKLLISSVGPQGNIGYPVKPDEIAHFIRMISETAENLTSEQISIIEKILNQKKKKN